MVSFGHKITLNIQISVEFFNFEIRHKARKLDHCVIKQSRWLGQKEMYHKCLKSKIESNKNVHRFFLLIIILERKSLEGSFFMIYGCK